MEYLVLFMNVITFLIYGLDKYFAIQKKWRVPERTLLVLSLFAPFGAFLAMLVFHHKTRKLKFQLSVPIFCFIWIIVFLEGVL